MSKRELFGNLTKENVASYAAIHYDNPHFTELSQFNRDLKKVSVVKKYMNKFDSSLEDADLSVLVTKIVNNIIIFLNMFGKESGIRILFTLMEKRFQRKLVPILDLIFDSELPLTIEGVNNDTIIIETIKWDSFFATFVQNMEKYRGIYDKHE